MPSNRVGYGCYKIRLHQLDSDPISPIKNISKNPGLNQTRIQTEKNPDPTQPDPNLSSNGDPLNLHQDRFGTYLQFLNIGRI